MHFWHQHGFLNHEETNPPKALRKEMAKED
jgi:hypothetical protein